MAPVPLLRPRSPNESAPRGPHSMSGSGTPGRA